MVGVGAPCEELDVGAFSNVDAGGDSVSAPVLTEFAGRAAAVVVAGRGPIDVSV